MDKILTAEVWAQYLLLIPLGVVLLVAAITDWRDRKIYNWLTYPAVLVALVLNPIAFGWTGILVGLSTAVVVLLIGLFFLAMGWLGGGDVKLLAVIGAALGPAPLFHVFFYSLVLGLVMGLSISLVNGYLLVLFKRIGIFLRSIFLSITTRTNLTSDLETDERAYLPFAIPIFVGAVFAVTDVYLEWPLFMDWVRGSLPTG